MRWYQRDSLRRTGLAALAMAGVALLSAPVQADAAESSCRDLTVPVSVPLLGPQSMHGTLCTPPGARTVQVLVPGGTYNSGYWDYNIPETHSYRRAMNAAGYATLAIDRLGTGHSSRPPGALLTTIGQANAVHQVIQTLKSGPQGPRFDKVIIGGHSLGSGIAMIEASTYHDVDGVLITEVTHHINALGALLAFSSFIPTALDPKFAKQGLDPGYLTTRDGTRYKSFEYPGPYRPAVANLDEATKDVMSTSEFADGAALGVVLPVSREITVPVMVVVGGRDGTLCGLLATDCSSAEGLLRSEAPFYQPAAKLHTFVLHGFGHAINLAPNAPEYFQAVARWADSMVGH